MTLEFKILIDTGRKPNPERVAKAIYRVIEHALDNDIAGAEILNPDVVGQVSVIPVITSESLQLWKERQ